MKLGLLVSTAAAILVSGQVAGLAQTAHEKPAAVQDSANKNAPSQQGMRAQIREMLQKAGFTDIHVMPGSFLIRAKDKDGNPVVMNVSPDSITEVTEVAGAAADDSGGMADKSNAHFVSIPGSDELSSNLVGLDVYNSDKKDIGQIKDVAFNQHGQAQAYILSVGGFLGIGEHYVAVNPSEIKVTYNDAEKKWQATMNATAEQLKAAPEFKYTGRWNANKT